jgi:hypothetical protein
MMALTKIEKLALMKILGDAGDAATNVRDETNPVYTGYSEPECLRVELRFEGMMLLAAVLLPDLLGNVPAWMEDELMSYEDLYEAVKIAWMEVDEEPDAN